MDYQIQVEASLAIIKGVLRLMSPYDYEEPFRDIQKGIISCTEEFTLDISKLNYLNSSGITAFAKLIILAKSNKKKIKIIGSSQIPWQKTSMSCLDKLYHDIHMSWL